MPYECNYKLLHRFLPISFMFLSTHQSALTTYINLAINAMEALVHSHALGIVGSFAALVRSASATDEQRD
jgi:predicted ferric reductase